MAVLQLNQVLNQHTIKAMEALEGCSIEDISKKIHSIFRDTQTKEEIQEVSRNTDWLHKYPPMLQACHVQEILGICEATAYQVMHHENCPTVKMGKRMAIPREDFWQFVLNHRGEKLW